MASPGMSSAEIENAFTYHPPFGDQTQRYGALRGIAKNLAGAIEEFCPASRERSLAMTKLREAVMWANASIACNEKPKDSKEAADALGAPTSTPQALPRAAADNTTHPLVAPDLGTPQITLAPEARPADIGGS